jgi:hypothetical protein
MEVSIVDKEPLDAILDANAELKKEGKTKTEGVRMHLTGPERKDLFFGEVHPNVQYEFEAEAGGIYTLCVQLTDAAFSDAFPKVRT